MLVVLTKETMKKLLVIFKYHQHGVDDARAQMANE